MMREDDRAPLVSSGTIDFKRDRKRVLVISGAVLAIFAVVVIVIILGVSLSKSKKNNPDIWSNDPLERAKQIQAAYPLIDGHNDLPWRYRELVKDQITKVDLRKVQNNSNYNTDIPRLRKGQVGAQFWSVYVPCTTKWKDAVRATMDQIDVVYRMTQLYPDVFELAFSVADINRIFKAGKIASLIGMEGGHSIDSSLGALRTFYTLGARYMTLTHTCNTPWAQSCADVVLNERGLTEFGETVVLEMNRMGMLVDVSHVAANTMKTVLSVTKAPVIFSHSSAYGLCPNVRNVPDDVLALLPQNGAVVMVNFYNSFINCTKGAKVTLDQVVEHIDYIVQRSSIDNVGIGSDYDGVSNSLPIGLEDVSKYIDLTAALIRRGYKDQDVIKIIGGNLLRAFSKVEEVAKALQAQSGPSEDLINFDFSNDTCRTPI